MGKTRTGHSFILPLGLNGAMAKIPREDRRFYLGLLVAVLFHSLLLLGVNSSRSRQLGDPSGAADGISVDVVTEAELRGGATAADHGGAPPTPLQSPATPPAPQPDQQPAKPEVQAAAPEPEGAQRKTEPQPDETAPLPKSVFQPVPELAPATPEAGKQALKNGQSEDAKKEQVKRSESKASKPAQPKRPKTRTTMLDLTLPQPTFAGPLTAFSGRGGAGLERPPGITRSGENDDFAKGVVRALQRTMPQLSETRGRVTVRITLDKNGSLVATRVVRASNVAGLDQSVVFSTQQASFPFPPKNAVAADLIFIVTYIYR
jgi:protein TonB